MRKLAEKMGVSHQKVSRWLREDSNKTPDFDGKFRGVVKIPDTAKDVINDAFKRHSKFVKRQASVAGIPFNSKAPAAMFRAPLRKLDPVTGQPLPGDRVIVERSQWMKKELRDKIIQGAQDSGKYSIASIRSVISLHDYFRDRAKEELSERPRKISAARLSKFMLKTWIEREKKEYGRTINGDAPYPLYTSRVFISPQMAPKGSTFAIDEINQRLRQKHEPATGEPGTVLGDQLLFQLTPKNFTANAKRITTARRSRKNKT